MENTTIIVSFLTGAAIVGVGVLVTAGLLNDTYAALAIGALGGTAGGVAIGRATKKAPPPEEPPIE